MSESKERLTYRPEPETRQKIEQWYEADNCRSMNEFIDKAVSFYADWLSANRNDMLPMAISSAMNGRLKILEKNLSSLSFKHAVELDMLMGIIADTVQLDWSASHFSRSVCGGASGHPSQAAWYPQ